ncbi:MAG: DUF72 domain-containing protein [Chloroflexota bacterium]
MGEILTGTASWTDPTLLAADWYPAEADSAEERLRFYASQFPLVEVDSTFYSLPAERSAVLWSERTPETFTFDIKGFRLFTAHPTPVSSLPKGLREELPADNRTTKNVYLKDMPPALVDEAWDMFRRALVPLHDAGKLGAIFLQFPKWFSFGRRNLDYLSQVKARVPDYRVAIEFRQASWMDERNRKETLRFLEEHDLSYTCVDEPQGTNASVPPIAAVTSELSVVRFHGRRQETWDQRGVGVEERFRYLYSDDELSEWIPKMRQLAQESRQVHALMNNCYADYGVRNAAQLRALVEQANIPVATAG